MGGRNKALLPLAGKPLLRHVIDRLHPQLDALYLSVEQASDEMAVFGLPQVVDPEPDAGPLAGLLAALQKSASNHEWLLLAPCDAPFIPRDLAARLLDCALSAALAGAVVRYAAEIQPTFSIWNRSFLPLLEQAVMDEKMAGFKQFLRVNELAVLEWPGSDPSPFFNINDQDALHHAGCLIESETGEPDPCAA
jgi:molybdopterin-guanine dinucleotide biosynthesis protein A